MKQSPIHNYFSVAILQIFNLFLVQLIVSLFFTKPVVNSQSVAAQQPYSFIWSKPGNISSCFKKRNLPYQPNNSAICLNRHKNIHLLPCGIGIDPNTNKDPRILIAGSTGVLGIAIASEFQNRNIQFAEIRSHYQFSISRRDIYRMIKQLNIIAVILLANDDIWNQTSTKINFTYNSIYDFCLRRKIPIFKIVESFNDSLVTAPFTGLELVQIKSKQVWGPIFLTPHQRNPGYYFYQCMIDEPISFLSDAEMEANYVFSLDAAKHIVDIIEDHLSSKKRKLRYTLPDMHSISAFQLLQLLYEKNCSFHKVSTDFKPNANREISAQNRENFNLVWTSLQTAENIGERYKFKPYASLVVCASDAPRIKQLFSLSLLITKDLIHLYPNLALEYVVLYCPTDKNLGKFYSVFSIPDEMRKFIRIIEIPQSYIKHRKSVHNITYFPEFDLKNIGIRRARGEYIFAINSDIILPIGFFDCVQKQAFSTLTYFRTHRRITTFRKPQKIFKLISHDDFRFQFQTYSYICQNPRYYDEYDRNGCGDFQGGHKGIWNNIQGFLETSFVFHVDTALSLDFTSLPTYLFVCVLGTNYHLEHVKQSNKTMHFKFYDEAFKNAIRQGVSSSMIDQYKRPNWGAFGKTFTEY